MPRIRHIALTTKDPAQTAAFYKEAFGLKELRRSPNGAVFLTDGHINLAVLNLKGEGSLDMGAHGPEFRAASTISASRSTISTRPAPSSKHANAHAAVGQGRRRRGDGRRRARQFRDEMVGPRRRRDRHLPHRLGRNALTHAGWVSVAKPTGIHHRH